MIIVSANLPGSAIAKTGGAEIYATRLESALTGIGFEVLHKHFRDRAESCDLLIINGSQGTVALWTSTWEKLAKSIWIIPHDSIKTYSDNNGFYWRKFLDGGPLYWLLKRKIQTLASQGAKVVAVSFANESELARDFGVTPFVIPNGVDFISKEDAKPISDVQSFKEKFRYIGGFVGRWDTTKNPAELTRMIEAMPEDIGMVIRSSPDGIYKFSKFPPFQHPRVLWLGEVSREELYGLYGQIDFLFLLSKYEGFGYVVAEAASCGAIPFVTPTGLGDFFLRDKELHKLVMALPPFGDLKPKEAWEQVLAILDLPEERPYLIDELHNLVAQHTLSKWNKAIQDFAKFTVGSI